MPSLCLLVLLAACGRIGFEPQPSASDATDTNAPLDTAPAVCVDGDGTCDASCIGMDTDCVTTCGDGRCVGNAGEKCGNCAADCAVLAVVCGNGICEAGETTSSCLTDCGPSPWPWLQDEADFLADLNQIRTAGFMCPGTSTPTVAPVLQMGADPTEGAHHLAWQIGHQPSFPADTTTCNGTGYLMLVNAAGYGGGVFAPDPSGPAGALAGFESDAGTCQRLMMSYTSASVGRVVDASGAWVVFLK